MLRLYTSFECVEPELTSQLVRDARQCGVDGVMLACPNQQDVELITGAFRLKSRFPDLRVGVRLGAAFSMSIWRAMVDGGLDMVWGQYWKLCTQDGLAARPQLFQFKAAHPDFEIFSAVLDPKEAGRRSPIDIAARTHAAGLIPVMRGLAPGLPPGLPEVEAVSARTSAECALEGELDVPDIVRIEPLVSHLVMPMPREPWDDARLQELKALVAAVRQAGNRSVGDLLES